MHRPRIVTADPQQEFLVMRLHVRLAFAALMLTAGTVGMAQAQPYAPVPPPRYEAVPPPPPGPRAVWEPGHWQWDGRAYAWMGGRYIAYRPHHEHYMPGGWVRRGGGYVWVPAHWR
jgi:hypothetical protein